MGLLCSASNHSTIVQSSCFEMSYEQSKIQSWLTRLKVLLVEDNFHRQVIIEVINENAGETYFFTL